MRTTVSPLQINTAKDFRTQRNVFTVRVQWPSCARRQRWLNMSCFTRPSYCSLSCARWAVLEHLEWRSARPRGRAFPAEYKRALVLGDRRATRESWHEPLSDAFHCTFNFWGEKEWKVELFSKLCLLTLTTFKLFLTESAILANIYRLLSLLFCFIKWAKLAYRKQSTTTMLSP